MFTRSILLIYNEHIFFFTLKRNKVWLTSPSVFTYMVGTIFTKYWYIIDAVEKENVSINSVIYVFI